MKLIQSSFAGALRATAVTAAAAASMLAASASQAADPAYFNKYDGMRMSRDAAGVLLVEMNTKGGPIKFSAREHEQFVDAFYDIGRDRDNKIVVLTGTGGQWMGDTFREGEGRGRAPKSRHPGGTGRPGRRSRTPDIPSRRLCC